MRWAHGQPKFPNLPPAPARTPGGRRLGYAAAPTVKPLEPSLFVE